MFFPDKTDFTYIYIYIPNFGYQPEFLKDAFDEIEITYSLSIIEAYRKLILTVFKLV